MPNPPTVRIALFVDFENVFSSLRTEAGEAVATRFANDPLRWLRWVEQHPGSPPSAPADVGRRALVRTCYLNPSKSGRFRSAFTSAGFRVVDCPSVTLQGKNSADIHMVMDILDALAHPTHFDEFVILSGDSDFRPVLLRLRAFDRRTVILTVGPSSSAYESASDQVIRTEEFVERALGFWKGPAEPERVVSEELPARRAEPVRSPEATPGTEAERELASAVEFELVRFVQSAPEAVPFARAAQHLGTIFGDRLQQTRWLGHQSFRQFLESVPAPPYRIVRVGAGFLVDPARHAEPASSGTRNESGLSPLQDAVSRRTGVPRRSSREFATMFCAIDAAIRDAPYQLMDTSRRARDFCAAQRVNVSRGDLTFILRGLWNRDASLLRRDSVDRSPTTLARAFATNVLALVENEEMNLDEAERAEVVAWITSEVAEGREHSLASGPASAVDEVSPEQG